MNASQESMPVVEANASLVEPADQKQLIQIVQQNNLHADTALSLQSTFAPLFKQARDVIAKSRGIVVTDAKQKLEIDLAKRCRLELKAIRVAGEKTRKEVKEESVRRGRAIDGFYNILEHTIAAEETRLEAQEKFVERQEAARKAALKADREKILTGIQVDPNLYALADMQEETFQQLVEGTKLARAAEAERKRKEEAERIERDAKEQAERERIRLENERLKKEAAEKEAATRLEREMAEKELKRLADEKRAAEQKAQQEREAAEAEAKAERVRKANLHDERASKMRALISYGDESPNAYYGDLTDAQFDETKAAAQKRCDDRLRVETENAAKLAEQKRIADEAAAKERARVAEEQRIAAEIARKEREAIEAKAAAERADSERKAAALKKASDELRAKEKAARDELEAKLKAQREADELRKQQEAEAARKAAAAPDRDRLLNYANAIRALEIPTFNTPEAKAIATTIAASRNKFADWCEEKANAL